MSLKEIFSQTNWQVIVVKPIVGASAFNIIRIKKSETEDGQKALKLLLQQNDCLIQPLMKEIFEGEISMIFLGKKFSHAIIKLPREDEFRVQIELGGTEELTNLSPELIKQGQKIINAVEGNLLYTRVDGIVRDGKFLLMELELIEPELWFRYYPEAANVLARAIKAKLEHED